MMDPSILNQCYDDLLKRPNPASKDANPVSQDIGTPDTAMPGDYDGGNRCDTAKRHLRDLGIPISDSSGQACAIDPNWPEWTATHEGLEVLRNVALCVAGGGLNDLVPTELADRWLHWLCHESHQSRHLTAIRCHDATFYDRNATGEISVKTRKQWRNDWKESPYRLAMLAEPEGLTLVEFEVALMVFDWTSTARSPRLAQWIMGNNRLLRRVHHFFLRRYCFPLLNCLHEASRNTPNADPRFAGWAWRLYPRIGCMCAVGGLGLMGAGDLADAFLPTCFATTGHPHLFRSLLTLILGVACLASLYSAARYDVRRQARNTYLGPAQSARRVRSIVLHFWLWGLLCSLVVLGLQAMTAQFEFPHPIEGLFGILARGAGIAAVGGLVQWIWEDRAATEPI